MYRGLLLTVCPEPFQSLLRLNQRVEDECNNNYAPELENKVILLVWPYPQRPKFKVCPLPFTCGVFADGGEPYGSRLQYEMKISRTRGAWLAQLVDHVTLDRGVVSLAPYWV